MTNVATKNGSKVYVCGECNQKIKEQEHPKCKECSKELDFPYFKFFNDNNKQYDNCCIDCWIKIEKDFRKDEHAHMHKYMYVETKNEKEKGWGTLIIWNEKENAWVEFAGRGKIIWKPPQKNLKFVRKYSAMVSNCCGGKCQRKLDDEPVETSIMNCNKCKTEFSQGWAVHAPNVFFCEACGKENHADGEFKVWIEAVEKENQKNPNESPKPNPPAERNDNETNPKPNPSAENRPVQNNPPSQKCKKCGKQEADNGNFAKEMEKNNQVKLDCEGWCTVCIQNELHKKLSEKRNKSVQNSFSEKPLPPAESNELCEKCGVDCRTDIKIANKGDKFTKSWSVIRRRITHYYTDFTQKVWYFGMNCSCAEQFKRENQQTCPQCQKREWPDMKKGWLLDYELKLAFCSPTCHLNYRQAQWEKENQTKPEPTPKPVPTTLAKKVRLFPMELELSSGDKKEFDWEKEASKKEVLILKEMSKSLTADTAKDSKTKKNELAEYTKLITENSFEEAKKIYTKKYGKNELEILLSSGSVQPTKKSYLPWIFGGVAVVGLIGGLVFFLISKQKKQNHE